MLTIDAENPRIKSRRRQTPCAMPARPADPGDVANARKDNESQKQSIGNGIAADSMTTTSIGGVVNLSCHGANVGLTLDRRTFKITSIEPSSAAGKSDLVHVGDVVLRVNGHCTAALEYERVVDLLANVAAGRIDLKIMRNVPKAEPATSLEYNIPPLWVESDHRCGGSLAEKVDRFFFLFS